MQRQGNTTDGDNLDFVCWCGHNRQEHHILAEPERAQMLQDGSAGAHGAKPLQCLLRDPGSDNYCLNYTSDDVRTCCKQ